MAYCNRDLGTVEYIVASILSPGVPPEGSRMSGGQSAGLDSGLALE